MSSLTHAICRSFWTELFQGTHDFTSDTLKLALYDESAALSEDTTVYDSTNEVNGGNYVEAGNVVAVASGFPKLNEAAQYGFDAGRVMLMDFDDVTFSNVTLSTKKALLYNSSKSNKAILVLNFGQVFSPSGADFVVSWPTPDVLNAIIRIYGQEEE